MSKLHERVVKDAMDIINTWMLDENLVPPGPAQALALGICMGELRRLRGKSLPEISDFSTDRPHKTRRN